MAVGRRLIRLSACAARRDVEKSDQETTYGPHPAKIDRHLNAAALCPGVRA